MTHDDYLFDNIEDETPFGSFLMQAFKSVAIESTKHDVCPACAMSGFAKLLDLYVKDGHVRHQGDAPSANVIDLKRYQ